MPSGSRTTRVVTRELPANLGSARVAREITRKTLHDWGVAGRYDDSEVTLVVSELVTNALRHAMAHADPLGRGGGGDRSPNPVDRPAIRLRLVCDDAHLVCGVEDPDGHMPHDRPVEGQAEGGRGLHIVEAISADWGWTAGCHGGKVVWASFTASPA